MALRVVATNSRSYRTGTFLLFSNSNVESWSSVESLQWMSITYNDHLLAIRSPERLGPPDLPRVPLHLEVFMTFRSAEPKCFRIVSNKHSPMAWVDVTRAKVTLFDTHRRWVE